MAFDQSTRNRLQKFVSNARAILSEEFTRQLQATYGLDPKQGTIATIESLTHLDNRQRQTAHLLRETLAHYLTTTPGKGEKDRIKQVLDRIVREQAFTILNRLSALRMAEARGFLLESVAKAHNSKGFQLYRQLSGTALGETGDAYRNYLFSLFDEFSLDLAVLFDRHSTQGLLFPRESALLELLAEINHHEIEHLWAEDETIGWIYQYFNSQEERKKMRAESQAPRNSRELAVRNQFFTPRYVVEFLTDNTLGRIWYEMTQGNTALVDSCCYLVRRPSEIFLKPGENAPESEHDETEALSQEELLKQPVYIPHRPLKDPRSIRMLDPACGSMHFGLYAFDLFERIYLEAWQLEQQLGKDAFTREEGQQSLLSTFDSLKAFQQQIPKLIIEHNIHGVDIDPRAVQIAGLSLWQRAQRAWHQQGIKPQQRPTVVKSNIVCAEPMPGEKALLQEFTSNLNPPVLGQMLEVIFDKMQLAGEAGTLLKIEEEIQTAIHKAREQWQKESGKNMSKDMFPAELKAATSKTTQTFDLRGIDDETFWDDAEQRILEALREYADQAESNADQKRLFAKDAAKGFAFIDLCRKRFDVLLMNPPFGQGNKSVAKYLDTEYSGSGVAELGSSFYTRAIDITHPNALFGSITSRTCFYLNSLSQWRRDIAIGKSQIEFMADLGEGILDDAMNETACYVIRSQSNLSANASFGMFHDIENKPSSLYALASFDLMDPRVRLRKIQDFLRLPDAPLCYWVSNEFLNTLPRLKALDDNYASVQMGLAPRDEYRYSRAWWEVPQNETRWKPYAKGGELTAYYSDVELVLKDIGDLAEIKANLIQKYPYLNGNLDWVLHPENDYFEPGLTFGQRTTFLRTSIIPAGGYFSVAGKGIFGRNISNAALMQAINTPACQYLVSLRKESWSMNPQYQEGDVARIPFPRLSENEQATLEKYALQNYQNVRFLSSFDEIDHAFLRPPFSKEEFDHAKETALTAIDLSEENANKLMLEKLNLEESDLAFINEQIMPKWANRRAVNWYKYNWLDSFSYLLGLLFGRWKLVSIEDKHACIANLDPFAEEALKSLALNSDESRRSVICLHGESIASIREELLAIFNSLKVQADEQLTALLSDIETLSELLKNPNKFFDFHLSRYSKNGRKAPIYLPMQSHSKSMTLWVYYNRLNEQTLYACVNDFIDGPHGKLTQVEQDLTGLRSKSARSNQEEKELEKLSDLAAELRDFRDELLRLAKFWKPNLNDGVQITAAPLWKLFQHRAWQKKLKETWEKLENGDYDWAHLACSIWPERVLRKCHQDRSLAIAHDVEDHFWHEVEVPVKRGKKLTGETKLEWQPKDLNEAELTALVKKLAEEVK
ncbi:BREX-1 system adenine-specific DNA-methyltransferase PglX [Alteromonas sp. CYL-A6]|uniref:BREX-1 system adenine-specific DNA-methyltransferase PglX n=1 Tax=Alteromonas nitratireducens TaxID=3390813 RepID=UPI0034AEAA99